MRSKEVSESRANDRLVPPYQEPTSRIAAKGNVELNHKYRELTLAVLMAKARLGAVVEIVR